MFSDNFEQRLAAWHDFREQLEAHITPIQAVIDLYKHAPRVTINCDPWDRNTWLDPWELLKENEYCEYCILLGICYTLQLTDKFKNSTIEIHICVDRQNSERHYLLYVDDVVIGYDMNTYIDKHDLPSSICSETVYRMPALQ